LYHLLGLALIAAIPFWSGCSDAAPATVFRIAVVGDSISDGVNPAVSPQKNGWVQMIAAGGSRHAALKAVWENSVVTNYSISGSTAAQWNSQAYLAGVVAAAPDMAVVYLGGNDVLAALQAGGYGPAQAAALSNNILGILAKLKAGGAGDRLVVIGYYDLFDGSSGALSGIPQLAQYSNMSAIVREGNTMLSNIARTRGALFIAVLDEFHGHAYGGELGGVAASPAYFRRPLSAFDIHPVTAGHEKLADLVIEGMKEPAPAGSPDP
jgi:lysophospholipase L1-like esterase